MKQQSFKLLGNPFLTKTLKIIQNLHENSQSVAFFTITALIIYMKKLLNSDWLSVRAVQFKCNTPV